MCKSYILCRFNILSNTLFFYDLTAHTYRVAGELEVGEEVAKKTCCLLLLKRNIVC